MKKVKKVVNDMGLTEIEKENRMTRTRDLKTFEPRDNENYVFISYKSDDWEIVLDNVVRQMINKYGLRVYYDKNFDKDNDSWVENMKDAICTGKCSAVLSFVSKKYMASYACLMELLTSSSQECDAMHDDQILPIIPIVIDDSSLITDACSKSAHCAMIKEWADYIEILDDAMEGQRAKEYSGIKSKLKVLKNAKQKITLEKMSVVMNSILSCKTHLRHYKKNVNEDFFENLKVAIEKIDKNVFDDTLIGSCEKKEDIPKIENVKQEEDECVSTDEIEEGRIQTSLVKKEAIPKKEAKKEVVEITVKKSRVDDILYYNGAKGKIDSLGGIVVLAGSKISKNTAMSCSDAARKKRQQALEAGELEDNGVEYELACDKYFKSLSGAAGFVSGYSVNGKNAWQSCDCEEESRVVSSRPRSQSGVSSKMNQILKVIEKVLEMPKPIYDYSRAVNQAAIEVSEELQITKSSVVDKCQRQLGLSAEEFRRMLMKHIVEEDVALFDLLIKNSANEEERQAIRTVLYK
ncbi:MAG: DUF4357 domain-containing protein [Lachnospiraceae bacterium]|nr:DUF4357 domain-containing protein [Lachnospiraceae bacterium]